MSVKIGQRSRSVTNICRLESPNLINFSDDSSTKAGEGKRENTHSDGTMHNNL